MRNIDDSDIKRGIDRRSFLGITGAVPVAMVAGGFQLSPLPSQGLGKNGIRARSAPNPECRILLVSA